MAAADWAPWPVCGYPTPMPFEAVATGSWPVGAVAEAGGAVTWSAEAAAPGSGLSRFAIEIATTSRATTSSTVNRVRSGRG